MTDRLALKIWVDFNNTDPQGRVRLNCRGSVDELAAKGIVLSEGLRAIIYSFELEADAIIHRSTSEAGWSAEIDWNELRRLPGDSEP